MSFRSTVVLTASLASFALARTDLTGCTSTDVSSPAGASVAWYVPGTGELCDFLDCGGGRAPPKTTVPGCPLYSGTATYSPSYLAGYGAMTASAASSTSWSASDAVSSTSDTPFQSSNENSAWSETATATETGAWSETTEGSSSLENSAVALTTLSTSASSITSAPAVVGNSTVPTGSRNGTIASATPHSTSSSVISTGAAMETARVWMGGAGLLGLGAIVAAL